MSETDAVIAEIMEKLERVRARRPLLHMIPNTVTAAFCADAIAAVGGRPLMAQAPEEMEEITGHADGLVVNLGQPSREKYTACRSALETAARIGLPVVLDPVGAGASEYRRGRTAALAGLPWSGVIKGNGAELHGVLTGGLSHSGVDSVGRFSNEAAGYEFLERSCGRTAGKGEPGMGCPGGIPDENQDGVPGKTVTPPVRRLVLAETGPVDRILWISACSEEVLSAGEAGSGCASESVVSLQTSDRAACEDSGACGSSGSISALAGGQAVFRDGGGIGGVRRNRILLHHDTEHPAPLVGTGCVSGAVLGTLLAAERQPDSRTLAVLAAASLSLVAFALGQQTGKGYGSCKMGLLDVLGNPDREAYLAYLGRNLEI